jgi:replicative DNA helicase
VDDDYVPSDADAPDDVPAPSESASLGLTGGSSAVDELAEQSTVGAMLRDPRVIDDVTQVLDPSDFWNPKHEVIALSIVGLHSRGEPTDVVAVTDDLLRRGELTRAGGGAYLHQLMDVVPTAANAGYYAQIVHEKAGRRRLAAAGRRQTAMGESSEGTLDELIERARQELDAVPTGRRMRPRAIGESLGEIIDELGEKSTFMRTPWNGLDKAIGGFARGQLVIVAGRPGGGKSIALLQIATRLAHEGVVSFSSLEMSEAELGKRLLAQHGPIHMESIRDHRFTETDYNSLRIAREQIQGAPLFFDETPDATLGQIRTHARQVARGGNLVCIVVDYLQLVKAEGVNREQAVASVAHGLKGLAKELGVIVVAGAQLKRAGLRRPADLPTLDDLRESGAIENEADIVILLHRDLPKHPRNLVMVVAKHRNGKTGHFTLDWQAEYARLQDKPWSPSGLIDDAEMA